MGHEGDLITSGFRRKAVKKDLSNGVITMARGPDCRPGRCSKLVPFFRGFNSRSATASTIEQRSFTSAKSTKPLIAVSEEQLPQFYHGIGTLLACQDLYGKWRCPMAWRDFILMTMFMVLVAAAMVATTTDGALSHQGLWVAQAVR
jgi:hypothetical protein